MPGSSGKEEKQTGDQDWASILVKETEGTVMHLRIGVYICHCGINIAGKVRVEEVVAYASTLRDVTVSREYKFMCSDPGQDMIEKDIHDFSLNRVVVASCSPRLHEKTFQNVCQRAGLNPYLFQMASLREQVSWVTVDEDAATRKGKILVGAAVNRVSYHERLETREVKVHPDVMVVGGGIAGMQAALDIADSGLHVHLVEKGPTIGGHMLQFDKTFPTLDCSACIGTPKMVSVGQHPNISLLSYSEVVKLEGFIGNYTVTVKRRPRYIIEGKCTGCGTCTDGCPVTRRSEWDEGLGTRKAIYRQFPQAVPITFLIDKQKRPPCITACPVGVNVQGYVQLIKMGKYEEAVRLIMERIPLPGVLGRVCPHPCEAECRRQEVDAPIAIRDLKRFAADQIDWERFSLPLIANREEKVAVIGSGPAGLTVAWDLRRQGYSVTIFEQLSVLGGMLRVGIPDYRLPQDVLDREINYLLRTGIQVETRKAFGRDFTLKSLSEEGFKAVFLGFGAHEGLKLGIPGEDVSEGVVDAIELLKEVNLGVKKLFGSQVIVIGGGNVAIDAARVLKRSGVEQVRLVYRRSRMEMPAYEEEVRGAEEEGIQLLFQVMPIRILVQDHRVIGLECLKTEMVATAGSGRPHPRPIAGSEFTLPCDGVFPAIGQNTAAPWADTVPDLQWTERHTIAVEKETQQTAIPNVFSGGDAVSGPFTVVEAIASGHRAAMAMHQFLQGHPAADKAETHFQGPASREDRQPIPFDIEKEKRAVPVFSAPHVRSLTFDEVDPGLCREDAIQEAGRCLNCGGCCECMECVRVCETGAIDHQMPEEILSIPVGSIITATGFDLFDSRPITQYGYRVYPNVFSSLEFERLNNATGPTGGLIRMRDDRGNFTDPPKSVAIVHCVGSRDDHYHEYCSRVCCMAALKYGHLIHDRLGHRVPVYDFYIDMRCFGKNYESFFRRCQEEGICFTRGKPAEIRYQTREPDLGKLIVIGEDTLLGMPYRIPVDMVVLCAAMEARKDAGDVARILGISQGRDGFFLEEHPKLGPLNTSTDGIFLAGACQSPKDIPDTVAQASGAAAKSLSLATRGKVEIPSTISWIDPDVCAGCRTCIDLCPYTAINYDERRGVSVVNAALCKGCGSCAAGCPSGAAQVRHFRKRQIFAECHGILDGLKGEAYGCV
ncbi:MAG: FAD-dependent oxidoreductase [Desulfobacterales bacterium]